MTFQGFLPIWTIILLTAAQVLLTEISIPVMSAIIRQYEKTVIGFGVVWQKLTVNETKGQN